MIPDTILVVDDDEINRGILENLFASFYRVEEAENGRIGLEKIQANPEGYCAVLLDVVMPEMDGLEVLRYLQKDGTPERIPVFLITAEASDATMRRPITWVSWTSSASRWYLMWCCAG